MEELSNKSEMKTNEDIPYSQPTPIKQTEKPKERMLFIDNIRIFLTILVILHHLAVTYGGSGDWYVFDPNPDEISSILLTLFVAINQSHFMSFFLLISGYFMVKSYNSKTPLKFLIDRLIRLGIPLILVVFLIIPTIEFMVANLVNGENLTFTALYLDKINNQDFDSGPFWFVQLLLIFQILYLIVNVIFTAIKKKSTSIDDGMDKKFFRIPSVGKILLIFLILAILTFIVRIWAPVGFWVYFEWGRMIQYTACFIIGIFASKYNWISQLKNKLKRVKIFWVLLMIVIVLLHPVVLLIFIDTGIESFFGGISIQAALYALFETMLCIATIMSVLIVFQAKLNWQNKLLKSMSKSSYTVYIIHALVTVTISILFLPIQMIAFVKFIVVAVICVPLSFLISILILKIPYIDKIL